MTAKIVEVLAEILDGLNKDFTIEEVNKSLKEKNKFDKQTVSAAFSLVYDKVLSNKVSGRKNKDQAPYFRLLTEEEKEIIGLDNYNYLMYLYNIGLLVAEDFEIIIEQLTMFPKESITKEDINWIILISLVDFDNEIIPGSRVLLYSSDTIN